MNLDPYILLAKKKTYLRLITIAQWLNTRILVLQGPQT
jgi:hypothetical protein